MRFHIHRFKPIHWHFEQPVNFEGCSIFWDYKIVRCRCGKQKQVLINIYAANRMRVGIGSGLSVMGLVNKTSII